MSDGVVVRALQESDREDWERLWKGYQVFYRMEHPAATTDLTWSRFHDPAVPMYALGAFEGERLIGIAHYLFHYATWTPGPYCYLQDLYTDDTARNRGAGRALIEAVETAGKAAGASRLYWLTHESNAVAMQLYDKVADRPGFVQYRKLLS